MNDKGIIKADNNIVVPSIFAEMIANIIRQESANRFIKKILRLMFIPFLFRLNKVN
jgi:hypothetical protein